MMEGSGNVLKKAFVLTQKKQALERIEDVFMGFLCNFSDKFFLKILDFPNQTFFTICRSIFLPI